MGAPVGFIAFGFGQSKTTQPGPSNTRIAQTTLVLKAREERAGNAVYLSIHFEVDKYFSEAQGMPKHIVHGELDDSGEPFVSTEGVWSDSFAYFYKHGVKRVVLVGHPFHLLVIRGFIALRLLTIDREIEIDWQYTTHMLGVPFDRSPDNFQWWTSNHAVFVAYLVKIFLTKKRGK